MKIYHTETQADYDALMVELESDGVIWGGTATKPSQFNARKFYKNQTCIKLDNDIIRPASLDYYQSEHPDIPIIKYKAKADEKMKFTKENVYRLFGDYRRGKNGINRLDNLESVIMDLDDTPEKAVVPKCFDDWYKEIEAEYPIPDSTKTFALWKLCQQGFGYGFERANGKEIHLKSELGTWLDENTFLAIDAVLNGYTIESEQLYYIPLPDLETPYGIQQVLSKRDTYFASRPNEKLKQRYTKAELEQVPEVYKPYAKPIEEEEE